MRLARVPDIDRSGPQRDNSVRGRGWSVRFDIEEVHVGWFVADGRRRQDASVCEAVLQRSFSVLVGGRFGNSSPHRAGRGWGTREPTHAPVVLSWTTCGIGCCGREVGSWRTT